MKTKAILILCALFVAAIISGCGGGGSSAGLGSQTRENLTVGTIEYSGVEQDDPTPPVPFSGNENSDSEDTPPPPPF